MVSSMKWQSLFSFLRATAETFGFIIMKKSSTDATDRLLPKLIRWVSCGERRSFTIEYGFGVCEEPHIVLSTFPKVVWSGTFSEFWAFIEEKK